MVSMKTTFLFAAVLRVVLASFAATGYDFSFEVQHKFNGRAGSIRAMRAHDANHHSRLLSAIDLAMGGTGDPITSAGLYYMSMTVGNPPKEYYVQIDTGSSITWLNCAGCATCPAKNYFGKKLTRYDPKGSSTAKLSTDCKGFKFCKAVLPYADGKRTSGYFVEDQVYLGEMVGNFQSSLTKASLKFLCVMNMAGPQMPGVDGLVGFGRANETSIIYQLASAGKVKKTFAHCLDEKRGGGIFTIGEVVKPIVRPTTPMLTHNQEHYAVAMTALVVGNKAIQLPTKAGMEVVLDTGATMTYMPRNVYQSIIKKIIAKNPRLELHKVEGVDCFDFPGSIDRSFPSIKFQFAGSLSLNAYPHDYLFSTPDTAGRYCIGLLAAPAYGDLNRKILMGDNLISNKLVVYDLEKQTVGWTDYDCSTTIKVRDEKSGKIYDVRAHNLKSH